MKTTDEETDLLSLEYKTYDIKKVSGQEQTETSLDPTTKAIFVDIWALCKLATVPKKVMGQSSIVTCLCFTVSV